MAKALIVTDDEAARYLYEMAITFQKIEVAAVRTIRDAVAKIERSFPDLVILDLETVDLDEMPLFKQLKTKGKKLPVIIMTDLSAAEAKKQACVLGACRILAKSEATLGNLIKTTRQTVKK